MKEADQFENWADNLLEGTWSLPDTPEELDELKKLLSKPLPCGADGMNATNAIYDLVGDDALFDDIYELSMQDPDADCRDLILSRLEDFGIEINMADQTDEDLDTDGVMMTRPSNMSSESIEEGRIKDEMIGDSETMSKEEFAKKYGKEAADEMFDESLEENLNRLLKLSGI